MSIIRTVSPSRSTDTFYYHIKLLGLHSQNSYDLPINFKIFLYKGYQRIDVSRKTHVYQGNTCIFEDVLTFNMPLYNPTKRKVDFSMTLVEVADDEIESTSCPIPVGDLTEEFMKSGTNNFTKTAYFDNDDFSIDYVLYMDKNKANLLALVGSQVRGATPSKPTRSPIKGAEEIRKTTSQIRNSTEEKKVVRQPEPVIQKKVEEPINRSGRREPARRVEVEKKSQPEAKFEIEKKIPEPEVKKQPVKKVETTVKSTPRPEEEDLPPKIVIEPASAPKAEQKVLRSEPPKVEPVKQAPKSETAKPKPSDKKVSISAPAAQGSLKPPKFNEIASGAHQASHIVNSVYITKQHFQEKQKEKQKIKEEIVKPAQGLNLKLIIAAVVIALVIIGMLLSGKSKKVKSAKKIKK